MGRASPRHPRARRAAPPAPDGYGDFACGHCATILLRGEIDVPNDEGRAVAPDHLRGPGQLVRCPECGWDNEVPRG